MERSSTDFPAPDAQAESRPLGLGPQGIENLHRNLTASEIQQEGRAIRVEGDVKTPLSHANEQRVGSALRDLRL